MYERFFQLRTAPFEGTPDPAFFFESEAHREALASVEFALRARKGVVVITGDLGAGKTTVIRTAAERCRDMATLVPLHFGIRRRDELLRHALRGLGQEPVATDHAQLLEQLHAVLRAAQKPVALLMDEAQTLADAVLDELRLLTTFDEADRRLVQIVLVGQNELLDRLAHPRLAALRQRVAFARRLTTFDPRTTQAYLQHRLRLAARDDAAPGVSFRGDAIVAIYRFSLGVPRLINLVADHALLLAFVRRQHVVTGAVVDAVVRELLPNLAAGDTTSPLARITPNLNRASTAPLARSA